MGPFGSAVFGGLGPGMEHAGINAQRNERRNILNRQFEKTQKSQQQATGDVLAEAGQMAPDARMQALLAAEDATAARTGADLKGAGADLIDAAGDHGAQSQAFMTAKADRALTEGNRQTAIAREMAKVRSVGSVQNDENQRRSALAEALGSMWSSNRAGAEAAGLDAEDVGMPWYGQLGSLINKAGGAAVRGGGMFGGR